MLTLLRSPKLNPIFVHPFLTPECNCSPNAGLLVYWKPHDSVQRPRVSKWSLKTILCIFWNYYGVLHDRLLEMGLMVTHKVNYHKWTPVANKVLFSLRENIEISWASAFARHCSYANDTSKKNWSSTWNCYAYRHSLYSSSIASNDAHLFHSLQHFLAAKLFLMTSRRWKRALLNILSKNLWFFNIPVCTSIKIVRNTFHNQIVFTSSTLTSSHFQTICVFIWLFVCLMLIGPN